MPKTIYQCDICKAIHSEKQLAEKCEKNHLKPDKQELIYHFSDNYGKYPTSVKLWFGSTCCEYKR